MNRVAAAAPAADATVAAGEIAFFDDLAAPAPTKQAGTQSNAQPEYNVTTLGGAHVPASPVPPAQPVHKPEERKVAPPVADSVPSETDENLAKGDVVFF